MQHYRLDTYEGPVVLTQRPGQWEIRSPAQAPEVYAGRIPFWCLARAREISGAEAEGMLAGVADSDRRWAAVGLERAG